MYRIGTVSMGIMLILAGIVMFVSQWLGVEFIQVLYNVKLYDCYDCDIIQVM